MPLPSTNDTLPPARDTDLRVTNDRLGFLSWTFEKRGQDRSGEPGGAATHLVRDRVCRHRFALGWHGSGPPT
jgi:hypothetical protein